VLSPAILEFKDSDFVPNTGGTGRDNLQRPPFTTRVELSDGGVYDNLGLETVWKNYQTVLVSNAGRPFGFEEKIPIDWVHQGSRVIGVMDNQVGSLRKRLLVDSYENHERTGTYWGIESNIENYRCGGKLNCDCKKTELLASVTTDLSKKPKDLQEKLINWGYAVCDAAIRSWVAPDLPAPDAFPYPVGVG
jgi:NTE family protein